MFLRVTHSEVRLCSNLSLRGYRYPFFVVKLKQMVFRSSTYIGWTFFSFLVCLIAPQSLIRFLAAFMSNAWERLKERFKLDERCDKPSCVDGVNGGSGRLIYPPDRSQIGRANWRYVHLRAKQYPENPSQEEQTKEIRWIESFVYTYPCRICARDFTEICRRIPPVVSSRKAYEDWWFVAHNEVNKDLSKPVFKKQT
jgi:FAD-linked sulfhydryl oxidase